MMQEFSLDDLRAIMRSSAGVEEGIDLDGNIAEMEFSAMGYDSLALLELGGQLERRYGFPVPEEFASEMHTPAAVVAFVNSQLSKVGN
nr:acyl carrier protein [uncultured bacterium]